MNRSAGGLSFLDKQFKLDTREEAEDLAAQIEACPHLSFLELRGNTIGIKAGERIAEALEKHPELKFALWSDLFTGRLKNEIPPILRSMCGSMMRVGTCLTELDLSDNAFGPIGAEGIQEFLCSSSAFDLKTLRLNNNGLGAGGVIIANCLLTAHKNAAARGKKFALKTFVAGRNRLEDPLAKAFKAIGTLEEITVPQNGIRKAGIEALAGSLRFNKNLRVINFNDNTCTRNGAMAIAFSLGDLTQLEVLDLGDCLCRANGTTAILSVLVSKPFLKLNEVNLSGNELPTPVVAHVLCAWSNRLVETKDSGSDSVQSSPTQPSSVQGWSLAHPSHALYGRSKTMAVFIENHPEMLHSLLPSTGQSSLHQSSSRDKLRYVVNQPVDATVGGTAHFTPAPLSGDIGDEPSLPLILERPGDVLCCVPRWCLFPSSQCDHCSRGHALLRAGRSRRRTTNTIEFNVTKEHGGRNRRFESREKTAEVVFIADQKNCRVAMGQSKVLSAFMMKPMQLARFFCTGTATTQETYHHYTLNVPFYTHFTSPIRRYADVMVHRLLAASRGYTPAPALSTNEIQKIAEHCNYRKNNTAKMVSDKSAETFFGLFVNQAGPLVVCWINHSMSSFSSMESSLESKSITNCLLDRSSHSSSTGFLFYKRSTLMS